MQNYNAKVRLSGSVMNEVIKESLTAPEVMILRRLHGDDAVQDIVATTMDKRQHDAERDRLAALYGPPVVEALFGGSHLKLPVSLPDVKSYDIPESPKADAA